MTHRFTAEEKGKSHQKERERDGIRRIKAPRLDNEALIKDNALTLIGRLTNPQEQQISALIPALPRKWNLRGRAEGADLGNHCFQFRFEREDDLRRVLDNRPYHFSFWMVIIQRWEPVISTSFPSIIPFWIRVKGLPLHYWHDDMVVRVGQDLGTLENHELTKTTARVRVHMDGLKPLIKEAIVEFDSGEEVFITLEYEKLEMHCSLCFSLLHHRSNCPTNPAKQKVPEERNNNSKYEAEEGTTRNLPTGRSRENRYLTNGVSQHRPEKEAEERRTVSMNERNTYGGKIFQERVDRHGRPFGDRISTKQTRNPPPPTNPVVGALPLTAAKETALEVRDQTYASPPYANRRELFNHSHRGRDLFPRRSEGQWRPKLVVVPNPPEEMQNRNPSVPDEATSKSPLPQRQDAENQNLTKEAVMEELHEVTRQYLNCPDPVEAAARRQRVLRTDAEGLMESTAASILTAGLARQSRLTLMDEDSSNPATPPPLQDPLLQASIVPAPLVLQNTTNNKEDDMRIDPYYNDASPITHQDKSRDEVDQTAVRTPRLRSAIVSPQMEARDTPLALQTPLELRNDNETLSSFQVKGKSKGKGQKKNSPARRTPSILRGAGSKKRNISQIRNSPRRMTASGSNGEKRKNQSNNEAESGPSHPVGNPPIRLIPAVSRKKSDFRLHPHQAP